MKTQPILKRATISLIGAPNGYDIPVICFEYEMTRVKPGSPFFYGSKIVVGKAREKRLPLEAKAAA